MPYVPSKTTKQPQAEADSDFDAEPELLIDAPADPVLFEPRWRLRRKAQKKREEIEAKKRGPGDKEDGRRMEYIQNHCSITRNFF